MSLILYAVSYLQLWVSGGDSPSPLVTPGSDGPVVQAISERDSKEHPSPSASVTRKTFFTGGRNRRHWRPSEFRTNCRIGRIWDHLGVPSFVRLPYEVPDGLNLGPPSRAEFRMTSVQIPRWVESWTTFASPVLYDFSTNCPNRRIWDHPREPYFVRLSVQKPRWAESGGTFVSPI